MDGLRPYPAYKDSGLPWLGQVPAHWGTRRAKVLFRERVEKDYPEEPLLAATQSKGVVRKEDYGNRTVTAQKDFHLLKLVEIGDFVISLRSFEGGIEVAHCRGIISPAYTVLEPRTKDIGGYFRHFFKSPDFISSLTLFVTGIREGQNIDYERLSRAFMPLPPNEEQAAIVRYLDHATRKIDKAIRAKRKIIALLNEQKQAIIHRAVTRGLDPDVPLKDSGIPWLGRIPVHWELVRNLALFSQRVEKGIPGLPVLQVSLRSGITSEELDQFGRPKRLIADHTKYKLVRAGDLAYNTMRMWQGAVGTSNADGLVSPAYVVLRPREHVVSAYYELIFRTPAYMQEVNRYSTGIVSDRNRLYWETFKQMPNIRLPEAEQTAICAFTRNETEVLDVGRHRIENEIDLLREYRTRLIADVVTGKLDVRKTAAQLPEPETEEAPEIVEAEDDEEVLEEAA